MTALIVAACIAIGILGIGGVWLILRRDDRVEDPYPGVMAGLRHRYGTPSVPGRDAPESPATTGPAAADPQWWRKGGPGIPAGGSTVPPGDTAVPAPASLPEGDEPAARPPQEAPAREPSLHAADHMRAEIWATRPWADDTGTFAAIVAGDGA